MAVLRSDVIIPELFTPYVIEQATLRDDFLSSGIVQPMAELNAEEGGDKVNVPFWKANLLGDFEVLQDDKSLTPGKLTADKQVGVILHRGNAWESRDLAAIAAGSDPMAAIGVKTAEYINHNKQKDLIGCLNGVFGPVGSDNSTSAFAALSVDSGGSGETTMSPRHVARARYRLGDQGDKLAAMCIHSAVYYDLLERKAIDFVSNMVGQADGDASSGSIANAFDSSIEVPYYMGLRVVVSDDVPTSGTGASTKYGAYFFAEGSVGSGTQLGLRTEVDRDILAKSSAMSIDLHYCYHPVGARWKGSVVNPSATELSVATNWEKVFETKNIGIVRATVLSNIDN